MARGWESKSVESQIESAEFGRHEQEPEQKTPEQIRLEQERASLEFARTRVLHEIEAATHPRHKQLLEAGLRHLETKLAALDKEVLP